MPTKIPPNARQTPRYSELVRVDPSSTQVYASSGFIAPFPEGRSRHSSMDFRSQANSIMEKFREILDRNGLPLEDVYKVEVFIVAPNQDNFDQRYDVFNAAYEAFFTGTQVLPARTCNGCIALPFGAQIEMRFEATLPNELHEDLDI